jgi:hypothetical protein
MHTTDRLGPLKHITGRGPIEIGREEISGFGAPALRGEERISFCPDFSTGFELGDILRQENARRTSDEILASRSVV